jgi:hypothetical protein
MDSLKNKKMLTILLFVVPLAIGIPIAMYLFFPSSKTTTQTTPQFDFTTKSKDSIERKLDIIINQLNELDTRLKKLEPAKPVAKNTALITKKVKEKPPVKKETVLPKKEKPSPPEHN